MKKDGTSFIVTSNNTVVKVLGTTFNIRSRHQNTDVTCLTGKVSFGRKAAGAKTVILTQGTGATLSGTKLSDVYGVPIDNAIPWIVENLDFNSTPLMDVFAELERYFNVSIVVKKDVRALTFTGKFKKPQLKSVLETVCLSAGLKYSIDKRSIVIE